jgi:radical SAM superfamily enzyme YgiQ (UPF0313 family)
MAFSNRNDAYRESAKKIADLSFAVGVYRPPSEGGSASLLLRITENCPWNKCTFCEMYKGETFVLRNVKDIKADIDTVKRISDELAAVSINLGHDGRITREVGSVLLQAEPSLYDNYSFITVLNWLASGGKTAFLQDANTIIMRPEELIEVLKHLRGTLKTLERVTSYARSKTLAQRKPEDLKAIREAGLDRLHVGLESGNDEVLARIHKGVTSAELIEGGQKAMAAGFQLSEYWMPGLAGIELWRPHAEDTARVLTAINPHYIRSRPFVPSPRTPIYEELDQGRLKVSSRHDRLEELRVTIKGLEVTSRVCFDHVMNSWRNKYGGLLFYQDYEGYKFPEEKQRVLDLIQEGLAVGE